MEQPKAQRSAVAEDLRAPEGANALAFAVLFALATVFLFFSYCMARALIGGFGAGAGTIALAVVSTFLASIFLWWFVPFADFAEIFWVHLPADRRAARGQCPHCGYPHAGRAVCSECGRETAPLAAWALSLRPVSFVPRYGGPTPQAGWELGWKFPASYSQNFRFKLESTDSLTSPFFQAMADSDQTPLGDDHALNLYGNGAARKFWRLKLELNRGSMPYY
jgi:hypothetical protein